MLTADRRIPGSPSFSRDTELPYLFCSCSLRQEDGINPVELAQPAADSGAEGGEQEEFSALIGNLVRNAHRVPDLEGNPSSYFVFEDMSVRTTGRFTLEFRLGEASVAFGALSPPARPS